MANLRRRDHLQLRGEMWRYRRSVPAALRPALGKSEIVHVLHSDAKIARQRAAVLDLEVQALFDAARAGVLNAESGMSAREVDEVIDRVCADFEREAVLADRHSRRSLRDVEAGDWNIERGEVAELLREQYERGHQPTAEAIAALQRHGVTLPPDALRGLLFELQDLTVSARGLVEADREVAARGGSRPELPGVDGSVGRVAEVAAVGASELTYTLAQAVADYSRSKVSRGKWSPRTAKETGTRLADFVASIGEEREVSSITNDDCRAWVESKTGAPRTVRQHAQTIAALFAWLLDAGKVDKNVARNLAPNEPPKHAAGTKRAYVRADLPLLFGEYHARYRERNPMFFWAPILALYSGARSSELCQLLVGDVIRKRGIDALSLRITIDGAQRLKSPSAAREIPLHAHMRELGFFEYVRKRKAEDGAMGWLFPERTPPDHTKGAGKRLSDHWSETRTKKISGLTPHTDFHSFRRLLTQELMEAGQEAYLIDQLTGHADQSMSTGVYGSRVTLEKFVELVELLNFREELTGLKEPTKP
jgi:integrase